MSQRKKKLTRKAEMVVTEPVVAVNVERKGVWQILKENWVILAVIILAACGIFANSLKADFVSDDYAAISQNPNINNAGFMLKGLNTTAYFVYIFGQLFGTGSPVPFHVFKLFLLLIAIILSFVVAYKLFGKSVAIIATAIFAVHPIHVEAITWISGIPYVIIAIYILTAFLFFLKFHETGNYRFLIGTGVAFILGFLTDNPRPFSLFLIIFLFFMMVGFKGFEKILKLLPWVVVIVTVILIIAWPNIMSRINVVNSGYNASDSIFYNPFFQYPTGISKYLQLLLVPVDLTLYHTMYTFPVWLNWMILLTYLTTIVYFYFKNKSYFFALSFILAAVLPSIAPIKVSWLVAERYMFLGSLGFCMFLAMLILDISRFFKPLLPVILGIIIGCFGVRVVMRNVDWQTNHNLWVNTCQVSPNSHNAWNNIGDDYDKLKEYDNAIKGFTQSTVIKANYADAYHNRANIFFKIGRLDLARDSYMTALYYSPGLYQTYLSLTQIDLIQGNLQLAYNDATKALQIEPSNPQAQYVLAVVYSQAKQTDQAVAVLQAILKNYPDYQPAVAALAQLKAQNTK